MHGSMTWTAFSGLLLVIANNRVLVHGNPVHPEGMWENPCAGSSPHSGDLVLDVPEPRFRLTSELELLYYQSQTCSSLCDEIKNKIVTIIATSVAYEVNALPPLDWFPPTHAHFGSESDINTFLFNSAYRLSSAGVFLDYTVRTSRGYSHQLTELVAKYRNLLCQIHRILRAINVDATSLLSADVVQRTRSSIADHSHSHEINYLIVRDIKKVLNSIAHGVREYVRSRLV